MFLSGCNSPYRKPLSGVSCGLYSLAVMVSAQKTGVRLTDLSWQRSGENGSLSNVESQLSTKSYL